MNVLGISAFYHDASAALIADGKLISATTEERYTRQKHDPSFPRLSIEHAFSKAAIGVDDLDAVIFYEEPHTKLTRVLASTLSGFPRTAGTFVRSMKDWMRSKLWLKNEISRRLGVHPDRVEYCSHHLSHAYQAFAGSSFNEAAVLTVDAVGEWASTGLFHARRSDTLEIKPLDTIPYPHSLGLLYSVFTAYLGFRPNDGESSVMALASFGQPRYLEEVRKVLRIDADGSYEIDQSYLDHFGRVPFTRRFTDLFGEQRSFKDTLPFSTLRDTSAEASSDHQRYADIAASIQLAMEQALLGLARRLHAMTQAQNLCLAGGVALNCVANSVLLHQSPFRNLFIPPDPGDGGAALGAAAWGAVHHGAFSGVELSPYLGSSYDEAPDLAMLSHIDPLDWQEYRRPSASTLSGVKLDIRHYQDFAQLVAEVVDEIKVGKVIGWFQGCFESGPRALGNRSLLADPGRVDIARRLSRSIKSRAEFRPYAFSVTAEDASRCMELGEEIPAPARWMQMVAAVKGESVDAVKAATHVDGTNRVQACTAEENPRFHRLLSAYGETSGLSALLNTSLNESGYPIVATPSEALLLFARTDLDTLVLNDSVVRKVVS